MRTFLRPMPRVLLAVFLLGPPAVLCAAESTKLAACIGRRRPGSPAVIELLTLRWQFDTTQPAHSTLDTRAPLAQFAAPADPTRGFTVKLTADLKKFDGDRSILVIPDVLDVRLRRHDPLERRRQNYPAFKMPDGSVPVLEANVRLHSPEHPDWKDMTIKGMWESESVDGGWRCISPDFPPGGDCTFFFHWGRFDHIIGGFRSLWSKPAGAPDSAYEDVASRGLDFYDGLNVPAISEIPDGRFLMAGWTHIRGWGGNLVIRELLQFPDGRIGSKWMDELMPETEESETLAAQVAETVSHPVDGASFLLTFDVLPANGRRGKFGISFLPESGERASCELQLRLDDRRAQFGPGSLTDFAGRQKSLREGGAPNLAGNYAIENLIGTDRAFPVRVLVISDDKIGGSLIDAEIAGQRTMLTYRPELTVKDLVFRTQRLELKNVRISRLGKPNVALQPQPK